MEIIVAPTGSGISAQMIMGRMCDGKVKYNTEMRAIRAALAYTRYNGGGARVYWCPICKGYHITTHDVYGVSLKNDFAKNEGNR